MPRVRMIEDKQGNLVAIDFFCVGHGGEPWPARIETDYDQYCAVCEKHLSHGLQCPEECSKPG